MNLKKLNEELDKFIEEVPSEYLENLDKAKEFCVSYICPELKIFAKQYMEKNKGLYGPNFDKMQFEMIDSYCSFTNLNLLDLSPGEFIDEDKQKFLTRLQNTLMKKLDEIIKSCSKKLEEHMGFPCVMDTVCDSHGYFAELGIVLGGTQLYGKKD